MMLLLIIIAVSIFFRFYNYPFRYGLGDETVREAVIGIEGVRERQAPLTGGFSSAGPFVWGPWFYYQMILAYFVAPFNYSPWIYLGITSVLCVLLLYRIGVQLEGKTLGLILAFLGSLSPALIISSTHLTFPNLTNVFALLTFSLFIFLVQRQVSYWWSFLFGIVLGISVNIHFQMAGLFIFLPLLLIYLRKKILYFIYALCGVVLTFIPLLLFDLTNHWHNLRSILFYYIHGKEFIYVPNRWLFYVRDFWPSYWADVIGVSPIVAVVIIIFFFAVIIWLFHRKKVSPAIVLILISFLVNFIQLRYYFGERIFGYLNHLRSFVFIFTGYSIYFIYVFIKKTRFKKLSLHFLLSVIVFLSVSILPKSIEKLQKDSSTMEMYRYVNLLEKEYPHDKFTVYKCFSPDSFSSAVIPNSVMFLLDNRKKLINNGRKIGVASEKCKLPVGVTPKDIIKTTPLVNFSEASASNIKKAYWEQYAFKDIYEAIAHWWYKENLE